MLSSSNFIVSVFKLKSNPFELISCIF
jgi:hypothetical protein